MSLCQTVGAGGLLAPVALLANEPETSTKSIDTRTNSSRNFIGACSVGISETDEVIAAMRVEMERLGQQNASLIQRVGEMEKRGQSTSGLQDSTLHDHNIEVSHSLDERLDVLRSVIERIEVKTLAVVQESNMRSQSRIDLEEEGSEEEGPEGYSTLDRLSADFTQFKDEQRENLEALKSQMESDKLKFNQALAIKDKVLLKLARELDQIRHHLENPPQSHLEISPETANDTRDSESMRSKRHSLPSSPMGPNLPLLQLGLSLGLPPTSPRPPFPSIVGTGSRSPRTMNAMRSGSICLEHPGILQPPAPGTNLPFKFGRYSNDGERMSPNSPLGVGKLNSFRKTPNMASEFIPKLGLI